MRSAPNGEEVLKYGLKECDDGERIARDAAMRANALGLENKAVQKLVIKKIFGEGLHVILKWGVRY